MKKLILIDGTGLIYRGFYSIPPYLKSPDGTLTNAVYGFTLILLSIIELQKPDYIAVAFDLKGPTFRHEQYKEYKATRTKAPDELFAQIPMVKELVTDFGIPQFTAPGFEADDVLATIVRHMRGTRPELAISIATGDFDVFQLADDMVSILYPTKGFRAADIFTPPLIKEKYGITPLQIPDYKGLAGDSSDNIPGVRGIGDKTATELLNLYGTLEGIYEHIEEIKGAKRTKLETGKESAFECRGLATLRADVEVPFELDKCHVSNIDSAKIMELFTRLGFNSLKGRVRELLGMEKDSNQDAQEARDVDEFDELFSTSNTNEKENSARHNSSTKKNSNNTLDDQPQLF